MTIKDYITFKDSGECAFKLESIDNQGRQLIYHIFAIFKLENSYELDTVFSDNYHGNFQKSMIEIPFENNKELCETICEEMINARIREKHKSGVGIPIPLRESAFFETQKIIKIGKMDTIVE